MSELPLAACINCSSIFAIGAARFFSCCKAHPYCRNCYVATKSCYLCKITDVGTVTLSSALSRNSSSSTNKRIDSSRVTCFLRVADLHRSIHCLQRVVEKEYLAHVLDCHGATSGETTIQAMPLIILPGTEIYPRHLPKSHLFQKNGWSFLTIMSLSPSNDCLWWTYLVGEATEDLNSISVSLKIENLAKSIHFGWRGAVHRIGVSQDEVMNSGHYFRIARNSFQGIITHNMIASSSEWILSCDVIKKERIAE